MSYTKQTWATNDIITAEKLNHMEDGIDSAASGGGGPLAIRVSTDFDTGIMSLNKTWNEIRAAFPNCYIEMMGIDPATGEYTEDYDYYSVMSVYDNLYNSYHLYTVTLNSRVTSDFNVTDPDGYPFYNPD